MNEIEFNIKTSEGESLSLFIPECGSNFFYFPKIPYKENPEFTNCFVLGSGGTTESQIILRIQPSGHKNCSIPHINVDYAYWDGKREKRIRVNDIKTLKMAKWIKVTQKDKEQEISKKIKIR